MRSLQPGFSLANLEFSHYRSLAVIHLADSVIPWAETFTGGEGLHCCLSWSPAPLASASTVLIVSLHHLMILRSPRKVRGPISPASSSTQPQLRATKYSHKVLPKELAHYPQFPQDFLRTLEWFHLLGSLRDIDGSQVCVGIGHDKSILALFSLWLFWLSLISYSKFLA